MNDTSRKTLEQVAEECGRYPAEAFEFVRAGLGQTVQLIHGEEKVRASGDSGACHISGKQLAWGLRHFAVERYGIMAQTVLAHWGITRTHDFGRIVFAMVESKLLQKTEQDDVRDFENVYEFDAAFDPPVRPVMAGRVVFVL